MGVRRQGRAPRSPLSLGRQPHPDGEDRCNVWHGTFPTYNILSDGASPPRPYALISLSVMGVGAVCLS